MEDRTKDLVRSIWLGTALIVFMLVIWTVTILAAIIKWGP